MEYPSAQPVRPVNARPVDAFEALSWSERPVSDARTASEPPVDQTFGQVLSSLPDWLVIGAGGVVAAILGAMVGGAMHI
tara:strand:+ start:566 stop:802 length:237 start_codon:yes stop_codon:yes gene_type:complete